MHRLHGPLASNRKKLKVTQNSVMA